MKNIKMKVEKGILTITVDLKKRFGKSGSGKSEIIATTSGSRPVDDAEGVVVGLNVYTKSEAKEEK
jgi:hypothetical protein